MNKHLVIFIIILILGIALILGWKYTKPIFQDRLEKETSDAVATIGTLHIGMDSWIGYFPLCSPAMQRNLRAEGYLLQCEDDQADYASRFRQLAKGALQFAAATVDSYLLNGREADYPGTVIMVVDESKGGDAVVARKAVFPSIDALKSLRRGRKKIAFTPNSPSEHLLKGISRDFGLPFFTADDDTEKWAVKTEGSAKALQKLLDGEADAAVLWEPDVSKALLSSEIIKLIGTEKTERLIVDVLVVERGYSVDHPEAVQALTRAYFKTLEDYRISQDDPLMLKRKALKQDIRETTGLDEQQIDAMLKGVQWATLSDNQALWFAADQEGLVDTINRALKILRTSGNFAANPLPGSDPYRITNRRFIEELTGNTLPGRQPDTSRAADFRPLAEGEWERLNRVGTLKVEPVPFRRGTDQLDSAGMEILDEAADTLRHYLNFRILVEGHTGLSGNGVANLKLSKARARAVADYLINICKFDPDRIRAVGFGSSRPLERLAEESDRAYKYRLSRVDISFVGE